MWHHNNVNQGALRNRYRRFWVFEIKCSSTLLRITCEKDNSTFMKAQLRVNTLHVVLISFGYSNLIEKTLTLIELWGTLTFTMTKPFEACVYICSCWIVGVMATQCDDFGQSWTPGNGNECVVSLPCSSQTTNKL